MSGLAVTSAQLMEELHSTGDGLVKRWFCEQHGFLKLNRMQEIALWGVERRCSPDLIQTPSR
jgi:hypothetical protein